MLIINSHKVCINVLPGRKNQKNCEHHVFESAVLNRALATFEKESSVWKDKKKKLCYFFLSFRSSIRLVF
jgi:hypothetical protein